MPVEWTPQLTLNHEELDSHHVELFRRIREAADALERTRAEAEDAVALLIAAVVEHAAAEEQLMQGSVYPERARHRSAHELFIADLERLRAELSQTGATPHVAEWLRVRVPEWLHFHICTNDAPLAQFLARRSPQGPEPRARPSLARRPS